MKLILGGCHFSRGEGEAREIPALASTYLKHSCDLVIWIGARIICEDPSVADVCCVDSEEFAEFYVCLQESEVFVRG